MSLELISSPCLRSLERRPHCRLFHHLLLRHSLLFFPYPILDKSVNIFFARRQSLPFEAAAPVNINIAKKTTGVTSATANRREKEKKKHTRLHSFQMQLEVQLRVLVLLM